MNTFERCLRGAGICNEQGYDFAIATYHFAMALAHSAHAETLRYHQQDESSAIGSAQMHSNSLQVTVQIRHCEALAS